MELRGPLRRGAVGLALLAALAPGSGAADELARATLGIDPSFAPMFAGRPYGAVLVRARHPSSDEMRLATIRPSIGRNVALGGGRRLVRLDRFGRKAEHEVGAALRATDELVLDLRHNRGGLVARMLRVAARFTGPVTDAVRLIGADGTETLAIPEPRHPPWRGRVLVLVGARTMSSGEVLAALLRRHAGARVLGERTFGKDYVVRVEPVDHDWRALVPDARIEVPGEVLSGGLVPDGPIPARLAANLPTN